MKAVISNFRQGRHHTYPNHMILVVEGVKTKEEAEKLVDKKVVWTSPAKKEISGKIASAHGNSGAIRAIFEKGMPGQCLGQEVKLS